MKDKNHLILLIENGVLKIPLKGKTLNNAFPILEINYLSIENKVFKQTELPPLEYNQNDITLNYSILDFGNSKPFRVRIINRLNDNYDHFYVKIADASRVYGLELEHILSPNRINYLTDDNTLIEVVKLNRFLIYNEHANILVKENFKMIPINDKLQMINHIILYMF
jgi:hypothetical protein